MKRHLKLNSEQQHEQAAEHHAQQREQSAQEFATAEDLLRFDAAHTVVPANVAKRLQRSTENLPAPAKQSWWRRFFGGSV